MANIKYIELNFDDLTVRLLTDPRDLNPNREYLRFHSERYRSDDITTSNGTYRFLPDPIEAGKVLAGYMPNFTRGFIFLAVQDAMRMIANDGKHVIRMFTNR